MPSSTDENSSVKEIEERSKINAISQYVEDKIDVDKESKLSFIEKQHENNQKAINAKASLLEKALITNDSVQVKKALESLLGGDSYHQHNGK